MRNSDENDSQDCEKHLPGTMIRYQRARHRAKAEAAYRNGLPPAVTDSAADQADDCQGQSNGKAHLMNVMPEQDRTRSRHDREQQSAENAMHEAQPGKANRDSIKKEVHLPAHS